MVTNKVDDAEVAAWLLALKEEAAAANITAGAVPVDALHFPSTGCPPPYTPSMPITRLNRGLHAQQSTLEQSGGDL